LPAVTGAYGVGTVVLPMVDPGRPGMYVDGSSSKHREFMTQIWYPANKGVDGPKSTYTDEATAEYWLKAINTPGVDKNIRFQIKTHAVVGAQVVAGHERFPVVIFSPGLGTSYFLYQSILEDVASHGYIVVGVNSPNSALTSFPDGHIRVASDSEDEVEESKYNQEAADDLTFVVNHLRELDNNSDLPFAGRVDFKRVGCFGHSFGGAASIQTGIQSSQVAAAIDFDGSVWGEAYKRPISKPMMLVGTARGDMTLDVVWGNLPKGSYKVAVNDSAHLSFSDYILIARSMGIYQPDQNDNSNPMDATRAIRITRDLVRTFFDTTLKHANPNQINRIGAKYPEVKVEEKLLSVSSVMAAPNFVLLYSKGDVSAYLDQESVTYDGTIIDSWLKLNISNKSYVVNYLFNTETKQMKAVKQRIYDSNNSKFKEESVNQEWESIDKDNMILYDKLLKKVKK